jgi:hypothetical protein
MPDQPKHKYSPYEFAEQCRVLADHAPEKARFLKLARLYDREPNLIASSLRMIEDSKRLIAFAEQLLDRDAPREAPVPRTRVPSV